MPLISVLLRLALSAIFGVAGITKLSDQRGTQIAVKNFGTPQSLAPAIAILLPIAELLIAAGFLMASTDGASALAALVVLTLFIIAIGVNLARGRTHDCHCFGQIYSRPLGWPTLLRNMLFALGAIFVYWQASVAGSPDVVATLSALTRNQLIVLIAVVVIIIALLVYVLRKHKPAEAEAPPRPEGLPLDTEAPAFELTAYQGGTVSLAQLLSYGKPVLLIFTNPTCSPCVSLFGEIKDWQQAHSDHLTIGLISFGTIKENFVNVARNQLGQLLLQEKREVAELYGANLTPTAVVVSPEGRIASRLAAGADEIRELVTEGQRSESRDQKSE